MPANQRRDSMANMIEFHQRPVVRKRNQSNEAIGIRDLFIQEMQDRGKEQKPQKRRVLSTISDLNEEQKIESGNATAIAV